MKLINATSDAGALPRSQSSATHARLKKEVLAGTRVPGDKLKINDIAHEFGVSPGAVREALSRLVPEGLVINRDHKGFIVAPLSLEDLTDLTQLRCDIEEIALRRSVAAGDTHWESTILAAAYRLRRTSRKTEDGGPNEDWRAKHENFHAALVAACGSPRLLALRAQLHQQSERYRVLSALVDGERDIDAEHQTLVDAALDRNADDLVTHAKTHFRVTMSLISEALSASPGPRRLKAASA